MIKNQASGVLLCVLLAGCQNGGPHDGQLQGIVELDQRVLGFEVGGRVSRLNVHRGDRVAPGDKLAALDDTLERLSRNARRADAEAAVAQADLVRVGSRPEEVRALAAQIRGAEATLANLRASLARERTLSLRGVSAGAVVDDLDARVASAAAELEALRERARIAKQGARPQEIRSAEARADAARSGLALADERLVRHELVAPVAATVIDTHVEAGEIVSPGSPVATLADVLHPYADVFVPEGKLAGLRVGTAATVHVDAQDTPFRGTIEWIAPQTEFTPRFLFSERERPNLVVRVRVRIDDPGELLHAGVPVFVTVAQ